MAPDATGPEVFGASGSGKCSLLTGLNTPDNAKSALKPQAKFDGAEAVIIAGWTEIARDLLAESVELAIGYAINVLSAIRQRDDDTLLAEFRGFDAAARTSRHCAEKLREKQRFLDGTGKSLLVMQLAAARALACDRIRLLPEPGRTLILSAEDDADEMQRRLDDIRKFYGARMADLGDLRLIDLVGEDSVLGMLMKGQIEPAPMCHTLNAYMSEFKPSLTALDVLADMYAGDENSRPQPRQFVGLLKKLAREHNRAILLLSHPSLTGLNSGSGTSATGWYNSVRSRLYFQTAKASDGTESDINLRTLQGMKAN